MTPAQCHLHQLETATIDTATVAQLAELSEACRQLDSLVAYTTAAIARRVTLLKQDDGHAPEPDDLLGNKGRTSARKARTAKRRGNTLGQLPGVGDELANGEISAEHLDAAAAAQHGLTDQEKNTFARHDAELARKARKLSPEAFRKHCQRLADTIKNDRGESKLEQQCRDSFHKSWIDPHTGMIRFSGALDPIRGETVINALGHLTDQLVNTAKNDPAGVGLGFAPVDGQAIRREQYAAQGLTLLASSVLAAAGKADITAIVDTDTLANGFTDGSVAETANGSPIPPATLARLCCGAVFQAIAVDPFTGELNVGRRHRTATQAQRAVLRALHATCAVGDCEMVFDLCHIHHILEWEHGGPTDLVNLVPLCWRHHHLVHEGGWGLMHSVTTAGLLFLTDGSGTVRAHCRPTRLDDWQAAKTASRSRGNSNARPGAPAPGRATGPDRTEAPDRSKAPDRATGQHRARSSGHPPEESRSRARLVKNRATEREPTNN